MFLFLVAVTHARVEKANCTIMCRHCLNISKRNGCVIPYYLKLLRFLKTGSQTYVLVTTTWNVSKLLLLQLLPLLMYLSVVAQMKPSSVTHTYPLNHLNTYMFVLTYTSKASIGDLRDTKWTLISNRWKNCFDETSLSIMSSTNIFGLNLFVWVLHKTHSI